ncbi:helix-turn-helix domain-containing protein [Butyrivibrio fibrisolvens]|uniref:helix-turn-helix domain-containing protein n=1 Tax=Butyrivibrio fibrisolvens TaxID=831 RepID=UPI0004814643|nr:helix-turn-helix transcriptional regulator [Butyrivibrio fibrisolvens]
MTVSDRVFQLIEEKDMTQKEFSELTGIPQSTVSDWRKKKTNPTADKIMVICKVLDVSPEWLLSGIQAYGSRGNQMDWFAIDRDSEAGELLETYNKLDNSQRLRLKAYMEALQGK